MQPIKLKPLSEKALYSQLFAFIGYSDHDRFDRETKQGQVLDTQTGQVYILPTAEEEHAYKQEKARLDAIEEARKANLYNNHPNPIIDYNNPTRWRQGLDKLREGELIEMCEEAFWHFLECVPPRRQGTNSYVSGEPYTHNSKNQPVYLCGIQRGEKYFAQYGTVQQYESKELFKTASA